MMLDDIKPDEAGREDTLTRPALAVELADRLRQMIVDGDLEPGGKVPEKALTERFGVSRTPLREALKVLAAEGYIRLIPNRGSVVSKLTIEVLEEAFPVIAALEGAAGELACHNASDEEIAAIRKLNDTMHAAFEAGDMPTFSTSTSTSTAPFSAPPATRCCLAITARWRSSCSAPAIRRTGRRTAGTKQSWNMTRSSKRWRRATASGSAG